MVTWVQLKLATTAEQADALSELLTEHGAAAVTLQDAADQPLYEPAPDTTPLWNHVEVLSLFDANADMHALIEQLQARLEGQLGEYTIEPVEDKEWERAWMVDWQPTRFGQRLWICPTWCEPVEPLATNVILDPGLAFGTGTHPTTRLCLEWLDAQVWHDQKVIDYGCGSGILGIAALKLGASYVWSVDNDPQALEATQSNFKLNKFTGSNFETLLPNEVVDDLQADTVVANILAEPLIKLAPELAKRVRSGGSIVLSGILPEQATQIMECYQPWFNLQPPTLSDGWIRVTGTRLS